MCGAGPRGMESGKEEVEREVESCLSASVTKERRSW